MQKVAIVTGSAKGLGRAIALSLASRYILVLHYHRSLQEAAELLKLIKEKSPLSFIISADLKDDRQIKSLIAVVEQKFKRVDLLVNNVGNFIYKDFSLTTNEEFCDIIESNIYSTLFVSRAVLPVMRKQKSGIVINVGTVGAERITLRKKSIPYFLAKTGVYALTKAMAYEEARYGIRMNMISPGSLAEDIFKPSDFPMGRSAKYADVVDALLFLLSDKTKYISGANIEVAGAFIPGFNDKS